MSAHLTRTRPDSDPGFRRRRAGDGFRYVGIDGGPVGDDHRERIAALVIPPAWTGVWISADPQGHIQAVGTDAAGRRQYVYHPQWRARRDRGKFARALELAEALPHARRRVTTAMRVGELDREHVLAVAFRLLDRAAPRIGSARYFERHGSRGLTTLQRRDATVEASIVTLTFPGKSGQRARLEVDDAELAAAMQELRAGRARAALLAFRNGKRRVALRPDDVNRYVRELTGGTFTAKDFRTLHGTITAAQALARIGPVDTARDRKHAERLAVSATAEALGNTPAVARSSYIDPRVFTRYARGETIDLGIAPESAIRLLLGAGEPRSSRRR